MSATNIAQQVVDAIVTGVRTAEVDVQVTPDGQQYTITVVSPVFEGLAQFKRRDMVQTSLSSVRTEIPEFAPCRTTLQLYSPSEMNSKQQS